MKVIESNITGVLTLEPKIFGSDKGSSKVLLSEGSMRRLQQITRSCRIITSDR